MGMTLQLGFMIAAVVFFIAAIVLAAITVRTYIVLDIRGVKDDLSGKVRQSGAEKAKRNHTTKSGESSKEIRAAAQAGGGSKTNKKRKDAQKSQVSVASQHERPRKSVADYQAEHLDAFMNPTTTGDDVSRSRSGDGKGARSDLHTSGISAADSMESLADAKGSEEGTAALGFSVVRKEVVVNSDKEIESDTAVD